MADPQYAAMQETDRWLQLWADATREHAVAMLDPDGRILRWSGCARGMLGYGDVQLAGAPFAACFSEEARHAEVPARLVERARESGSAAADAWLLTHEGVTVWASVALTALCDTKQAPIGFVAMIRDVSATRAAQEAAIESERRFRLLVQGVTDYAIFMLSPDGFVTNWNQGAHRIKGYTANEIIGSHFSRFYTPEDAASGLPARGLATAAREGRFEAEGWRVRRDGTRFWAHVIIDAIRDDSGMLIGFAKVTRDVTERREAAQLLEQTRAALFQAQKMEAIGKLTGGVAHDFNNVLQVLRGNLELLEQRHCRDAWTVERLGNAINAVERGAKLAAQLLAFGRRQPLRPVAINLGSVLGEMDELLRRAIGETIEVETVTAAGLWNTFVDTHQLENVILNLAINARDAMPGGGKLTLELANVMLDDHYVRTLADVPAGQYVMLGVTDTGTGMSAEVIEHAFEPFFTTKPEGQGTGLGLSMAYGFIKQSGGHIRIYSELDHGTTVKVYLPRSLAQADALPVQRGAALMGGRETVLVVEDDLKVQGTVVEMLTELGYTVLKADDADEALAVMRSGVRVDLLFSDVVMPGSLRSTEMASKAVALLPHLKVLFTSGYPQNAVVHGGRLDPGVELLSKPYSRGDLARKVRHVLGTPGETVPEPELSAAPAGAAHAGPAVALRILVVDDDAESHEALCQLLELLGHQSQPARDANEAFVALAQSRFDVLLTDIHLPRMSGIELARAAQARQPGLRIVLASGDDRVETPAGMACWRLHKPYTLEELEAVLRAVGSR